MEKTEDIRLLIDRFFEAETTLAEEQRLYRYFSGATIDPELEEYREVFLSLDAWALSPEEQLPATTDETLPTVRTELTPQQVPTPPPLPLWHKWLHYAAAASVVLVVGLALRGQFGSVDRCIGFYDGYSTTDEQVVMSEMASVMHGIMSYEPEQDVEQQLSEIFGR